MALYSARSGHRRAVRGREHPGAPGRLNLLWCRMRGLAQRTLKSQSPDISQDASYAATDL